MNAIRTAGVCLAAGLLAGCAQKKEQPKVVAQEPAPMQAAESLRQNLQRANPDARVGIVAATVGNFAAVRDVPAGNVAENTTVQVLDPRGDVIGYGVVRAVKDNSIHVLYQPDARRGPQIGDLIMPASDAGVPVEEMPAGAGIQAEEQQAAEPTRLPPRRNAAPVEAPAEAAAEAPVAAPTDAQPEAQPEAQPDAQPVPPVTQEAQPDFQPTQPNTGKAGLPPVDGADAAAPAPDAAAEPTTDNAAPAPDAAPAPADNAGAPAPDAAKEGSGEAAKEAEAARDAAGEPAPEAEGKAPEAETPDQNK